MTCTLSAFADEAGQPIAEQIAALNADGIRYVDLRNVEQWNIVELPEAEARTIQSRLADAAIAVGMYGSPIGKIDIADDMKIDLGHLEHLAKMRDIFGCDKVRIFSYYNKTKGLPAQRWHEEGLKRLTQLRDLARKLGLVLYHENEGGIFGDHLAENQLIAEKVRDGEHFKLIFDFDNYNRGGDDVWANWEALRDVTDCFHLKDSDTGGQHVPVGTGNGKVREILTDAHKRGWTGPMSLEPHLRHSGAVAKTHVSGIENQSYKSLSPAECFSVAARAARKLLEEVGIRWS
ncbi:MAG: TIM barrel protein [Phycisphaeraceae bacterium]|nr:TIM barrel protein [Phycisphaeraceae bacterium]